MRVGFLHDASSFVGGAERTMAEFAANAPPGVTVLWQRPGMVRDDLDRYVVGNCFSYTAEEIPDGAVRYHHDVNRAPADEGKRRDVYCSVPQRERMGGDGIAIPPAIDLRRFRNLSGSNHRKGAVCIGRMAYGKGTERLAEYSEPVDVYSHVTLPSNGSLRYQGPTTDVPSTLARYEKFVFLPTAFEPFGRAVVEAWAAGLQLILNRNVGARYWLADNPAALETAAADFWNYVLHD